jgi:flagellin-specific chaperone FliS
LKTQLHNAVTKGKISKQDKYADKLDEIFKSLTAFLDTPTKKTIEITEQELSGLNCIGKVVIVR